MHGNKREVIGIINHKVGDRVLERFHGSGVAMTNDIAMQGTVVYVHPCGRYYTVEFEFAGGRKARESYTVRSDVNPVNLMLWSRRLG